MSPLDWTPAATTLQLSAPFSTILAWFVYRKRIDSFQIAGLVIAFTGVYALAGDAVRSSERMGAIV
jgi:drug/metabolite transporter (DMT)-like permease